MNEDYNIENKNQAQTARIELRALREVLDDAERKVVEAEELFRSISDVIGPRILVREAALSAFEAAHGAEEA